tara:strand:- start:4968 stop:5882 length:915 start_codon:yes stop_codon:yes gene_type:complete
MQIEAEIEEKETENISVEVDVEDASSEVVENKLNDKSQANVQAEDSEELEQYSKGVQKRIQKLTAQRRQAEEEAHAAVQYIQQVQSENEQMKKRLQTMDTGYMSEFESRIASQEIQAKKALTEAHEAGDYGKVADAQSAISQIAIEKERLRLQKQRAEQAQQHYQNQVQQQAQQPQRQAPPPKDPKLESWISKNPWFNTDNEMTNVARAIHQTIVFKGYNPESSPDEYYAEIDKRMREEFPDKFQGETRNVQRVTPANGNGRSLKSGRKKSVELNPGQVALAQKLKIPLDRYAAEVAKLESGRN